MHGFERYTAPAMFSGDEELGHVALNALAREMRMGVEQRKTRDLPVGFDEIGPMVRLLPKIGEARIGIEEPSCVEAEGPGVRLLRLRPIVNVELHQAFDAVLLASRCEPDQHAHQNKSP